MGGLFFSKVGGCQAEKSKPISGTARIERKSPGALPSATSKFYY